MTRRGFSLLELLLALALMSLLFLGVFSLALALPQAVVSGELRVEALLKAHSLLTSAVRLGDYSFSSLQTIGTSSDGVFSQSVTMTPTEDESFADVTSFVSWKSLFGNRQSQKLWERVADASSTPSSCDPFVSGDWAHPQVAAHYALSTTDILSGAPAAQYSLGTLATTPKLLVLGMASTSVRQAPTLLFLGVSSTSIPSFIIGFDNASTSRVGISSIAISGNTVFSGTAFGSASAATCSDGLSCAQVQTFSTAHSIPERIGVYAFATTSPPYAQTAAGLSAAVRTLTYYNGYLFVGLEKTARGSEFNVLDAHDPAHLSWQAGFSVGRSVTGITVRDGYAYLSTDDPTRELIVLNVTDPTHPLLISSLDLGGASGFGFGVVSTVRGGSIRFGRTYSPNGKEFALIDATTPTTPRVVQEKDSGPATDPESVRGLLTQDWLSFLLLSHRIEFWNTSSATTLEPFGSRYSLLQGAEAVAHACRHNRIYVGYTVGANSYIDVLQGS